MSTGNWRDGYSKEQVIQRVRLEFTSEFLNNPHKGTATFQRFNGDLLILTINWDKSSFHAPPEAVDMESLGVQDWDGPHNADLHNDHYPPSSVAYCRWSWNLLEPEKGKLRFDIIDRALATAAARGQTLQLRTQPFVGPGSKYECPQWYWDAGARLDPAADNSDCRVPDHNDPLWLEHWGNHIRALGARYDGHPNLESFDLAYGGGCGEGGGNCTPDTAHKLAEIYLDSFQGTPLLTMLGTEGCHYAAGRKGANVGWRADCFGDLHLNTTGEVPEGLNWNHMYDMYVQEVTRCGLKDAWKTAPAVFETCWAVPYWHKHGWDIDWIIEQGYKYHISVFMPKSMAIPDAWMGKILAFSQRIGYWFHLQQMVLPLEASARQQCKMSAVIDNKGIAPIYRPYRLALRFSQGKTHKVVALRQDIRRWMPDLSYFEESFAFPAGLVRGEAKVSCGIVDANDKPVVRLAVKAVDAEGWHPLTSIDVL